MKIVKRINYWLRLFGFRKRQESQIEQECNALKDKCAFYKNEAKEATKMLRLKHQKQTA